MHPPVHFTFKNQLCSHFQSPQALLHSICYSPYRCASPPIGSIFFREQSTKTIYLMDRLEGTTKPYEFISYEILSSQKSLHSTILTNNTS